MKERLTGAIILVALIVLLVPELLTGPIRPKSAPAHPPTTAIAPLTGAAAGPKVDPQPPLRSYTLTLGAAQPAGEAISPPAAAQAPPEPAVASPDTSAPSAGTAGAAAPDAGGALEQAPVPQPTVSHAPARTARRGAKADPGLQGAKSPAHHTVREARTPASSGGWVVQLGSFASRDNADRLARSLAGRGFHMSVSPAHARSRVLWRVRAGPVHDRAGAERLAARLRALGHRGELIPVR